MIRVLTIVISVLFCFSAFATTSKWKSKSQRSNQHQYNLSCRQINAGLGNSMPDAIQLTFATASQYSEAIISAVVDGQATKPMKLKHWPNRVIANTGLIYQIDWQGAGQPWLMQIFDSRNSFYSSSLADYACY